MPDRLVVSLDLLLPVDPADDPQYATTLIQQVQLTLARTYGIELKRIAGWTTQAKYDQPAATPDSWVTVELTITDTDSYGKTFTYEESFAVEGTVDEDSDLLLVRAEAEYHEQHPATQPVAFAIYNIRECDEADNA